MPLGEEEWARVSAELPKQSDAVVQAFLRGRAKLIAEEQKHRSGIAQVHGPSLLPSRHPEWAEASFIGFVERKKKKKKKVAC